MGYFDGIVDGKFKATDDGVVIFYPYGIFGAGYIIPSIERKQEIRKQLKRFASFSLTVIIISTFLLFRSIEMLLIPWWISGLIYLAVIAGIMLGDRVVSKRLIEGLTQIDKKLSLAESYQNSARSHNMFVLIMLESISLLFVIAGIWMMLDDSLPEYSKLIGVLNIIFFGLCSIAGGYMIKVKNKR